MKNKNVKKRMYRYIQNLIEKMGTYIYIKIK